MTSIDTYYPKPWKAKCGSNQIIVLSKKEQTLFKINFLDAEVYKHCEQLVLAMVDDFNEHLPEQLAAMTPQTTLPAVAAPVDPPTPSGVAPDWTSR